ncbi:unnamed protein product [Lymnaea stagnalis]|uniref:Neurotransmitter-gated ion-channel ligand-binding domain-containing protein n=1 Tax=Lymnaea stagnalis TaxID=6523 RepID=A0AAV2HQ01_LYMST
MEASHSLLLVALLAALQGRVAGAGLKYDNVTEQIINGPSPDVIPIPRGSWAPLDVSVEFDFINIAKVDAERNEVEVVLWQSANWSSPIYAWNMTEPNQAVSRVTVPARYVWVPDFTVIHGVSEIESPNLVSILHDGTVHWVTSQRIRVLCDVGDAKNASGVTCTVKIVSWTHNANVLRLNFHPYRPTADTANYFQGSRYELLNTTVTKNSMMYPCCAEVFEDVALTFSFKERGVEAAEDADASSSALRLTSSTIAFILALCFVVSLRRN